MKKTIKKLFAIYLVAAASIEASELRASSIPAWCSSNSYGIAASLAGALSLWSGYRLFSTQKQLSVARKKQADIQNIKDRAVSFIKKEQAIEQIREQLIEIANDLEKKQLITLLNNYDCAKKLTDQLIMIGYDDLNSFFADVRNYNTGIYSGDDKIKAHLEWIRDRLFHFQHGHSEKITLSECEKNTLKQEFGFKSPDAHGNDIFKETKKFFRLNHKKIDAQADHTPAINQLQTKRNWLTALTVTALCTASYAAFKAFNNH